MAGASNSRPRGELTEFRARRRSEVDRATAETLGIEEALHLEADVLGALVEELLAGGAASGLHRQDRRSEADAPLRRQWQQTERAEQREQARYRNERNAKDVRQLRDAEEGAARLLGADHCHRDHRRLAAGAEMRDARPEGTQAVRLVIRLPERL